MKSEKPVERTYKLAQERYADMGVNTDDVLKKLAGIKLSLHCWQTDDVGGFERPDASLGGGGIQVTGNYPGKARNVAEMRQDLEKVYALVPGKSSIEPPCQLWRVRKQTGG